MEAPANMGMGSGIESTPTVSTMEQAVDAALATGDASASPADSGGDTGEASAPPAPPATQDAAAAPAKEPAEAQQPEVAIEDDSDPDDDSATDAALADAAKASNLLDLKLPRGQRIYGAYKAYKGITDALGHEPTAEEVVGAVQAYTDQQMMLHEFGSLDPKAQGNFIHYWNVTDPAAMQRVAAQLPEYLAQANPEAYGNLGIPVMQRFIKHAYVRAQQETDPNVKQARMYMARMLDWDLNGQFANDQQLPQTGPTSAVSAREAQIQQQLVALQQANQQQMQRASAAWANDLYEANGSALTTSVEEALEPIKTALTGRLYQAAQKDFKEAVQQHLAKDVEGDRMYQIQWQKAQSTLSREDQERLASQFAQRASRAVRALAPKFLKELGVQAKANNDQRHAALAASAQQGKAPVGGGAPTQQSIAPTPKQYASRGDQFDDMLSGLLGASR